jgi:hypothetical protein
MRKPQLDPKIREKLTKWARTKGHISESSIRPALSEIRRKNPRLTLNAAAEVFARQHDFTVAANLKDKDRESMSGLQIQKVMIRQTSKQVKPIIKLATYQTEDGLLKAHLDEINRAYTYHCYTAAFILCRKVLENLITHHILRRKYPEPSKEHREKYFDFGRRRFLDFDRLLTNLGKSSGDFGSENKLVKRIVEKSSQFKETANEMTHSLYHIATKKEIDDTDFQSLLDLIQELEKMHFRTGS